MSSNTLIEKDGRQWLEPDLDHLVVLLQHAVTADDFKASAQTHGPLFVSREHNWDRIVQKLNSL